MTVEPDANGRYISSLSLNNNIILSVYIMGNDIVCWYRASSSGSAVFYLFNVTGGSLAPVSTSTTITIKYIEQ